MEKAILNLDNLYVTQGMNGSFSHKGVLAIDIAKCTYLKAPFTGIVKKIYKDINAVWLESMEKVKFADGVVDYMTVLTMHDNNISNIKVGQKIKQGEIYYHPGTKGYTTGSHIHITIGRGKFSGTGWFKNSYGNFCINNQYEINKGLFLSGNTKITKSLHSWVKNSNKIISSKSIETLAREVIDGKWGNGDIRKNKLTKAGYNYNQVQKKVNELLKVNKVSKIEYIVKKGDTLSSIAKKYNMNWKDLYDKNKNIIDNNAKKHGIKKCFYNYLSVGLVLKI